MNTRQLKCKYGQWNGAEHSVGILSHYTYFKPLKLKCRTVEMLTFNPWVTDVIYIYIYIYICGAPILDVSRSHMTTQHSR
jgi:hypothetical protein